MSDRLKATSQALIRRSRGTIMTSCERLVGRRPWISGGDARLNDGEVRQRVRALLSRGISPGIRPREIRSQEAAALVAYPTPATTHR